MRETSLLKADVQTQVQVRSLTWKDLARENIPWLLLLLLVAVFALIFPQFLNFRNFTNILRNSSLVGTVAIGMTFAMIGGTFDLSVGTMLGLATVVTILVQPTDLGRTLLAVAFSLLAGALVGLANGLIVGRWRTNSIVTTIGTMYAVLGVTLVITQGQHVWVTNMYPPLEFIGKGRLGEIPSPIFIFLGMALICQWILSYTRFGRYLYATGGNMTTAMLSGVNVGKIRIYGYMVSSIAAAVAGVMIAARVQNVDPAFGFGQELDVLTCVLLGGTSLYGGRGNVLGTVAGVLLLGVVTNAMTLSGISYELQLMMKGAIMVAAVAANVLLQARG